MLEQARIASANRRDLSRKSPKSALTFHRDCNRGLSARARVMPNNGPTRANLSILMSHYRLAAGALRAAHLQRIDVDYRAIVRLPDGHSFPCRVKNISPMGALIEFPEDGILCLHASA